LETLLGFLSPSFLRSSGHGYGHLGLIGHGLCFKASSNDNRLAPFSPKNLSGPLQNLTLQHFRRVSFATSSSSLKTDLQDGQVL